MSGDAPIFVSLAQVLELHAHSLALYGGTSGIRDCGQVESAIGAAESEVSLTGARVLDPPGFIARSETHDTARINDAFQ